MFAAALGGLLGAQPGREMAHGQGHGEVGEKQHQVGGLADVKGEDGRDKQIIPDQGGEGGGQQRGPAADKHRQHDDAEEIHQRERLITQLFLQKSVQARDARHHGQGHAIPLQAAGLEPRQFRPAK